MTNCNSPEAWQRCYHGAYDLLTPEAIAHPAKMAPGLCFRICAHLKELGLLKAGDTILDPMAGTGMTGLVAATLGYRAVLVELEPYFRDLIGEVACEGVTAQLCKRMLKGSYSRTRKLSYIGTRICPACQLEVNKRREAKGPRSLFRSDAHIYGGNKGRLEHLLCRTTDITITQGDSRKLSELVQGAGIKAVLSPPYGDAQGQPSLGSVNKDSWGQEGTDIVARRGLTGDYGSTPGQIGNLRCITSPPYGDSMGVESTGIDYTKMKRSDGTLRDMTKEAAHKHSPYRTAPNYGSTPGQIGSLRCITSPPYGDSQEGGGIAKKGYQGNRHDVSQADMVGQRCGYTTESHGQTPGQMGNIKGQSYESEMLLVYREIAKLCDVCAVVTKNPTRDRKLQRLDLLTESLLQQAGFRILCRHKAILFEDIEHGVLITDQFEQLVQDWEHAIEADGRDQPNTEWQLVTSPPDAEECLQQLADHIKPNTAYWVPVVVKPNPIRGKKAKGRLGFFKRLSWQNGAEVAKWEDVIIAVRNG